MRRLMGIIFGGKGWIKLTNVWIFWQSFCLPLCVGFWHFICFPTLFIYFFFVFVCVVCLELSLQVIKLIICTKWLIKRRKFNGFDLVFDLNWQNKFPPNLFMQILNLVNCQIKMLPKISSLVVTNRFSIDT